MRSLPLSFAAILLGGCVARAATVAPISFTQVPASNSASVFDVNAHPSNVVGLGPGTTSNPGAPFDVRDLFGGHFGTDSNEPGNMIVTDKSEGFVDSVLVALPNPVRLTSYNLFLSDDGADGNRSASEFRLYAGTSLVDDVHPLDGSGNQTYTSAYGSNNIKITNLIPNAPFSSNYTLQFVQNQGLNFGGVRADEFEAFVPEPGTIIIVLGIVAWLGLPERRTAQCCGERSKPVSQDWRDSSDAALPGGVT